MPLSKQRNRDRMRLIRRNKRSLSPQECKSVQPRDILDVTLDRPTMLHLTARLNQELALHGQVRIEIDADGNVIPDE